MTSLDTDSRRLVFFDRKMQIYILRHVLRLMLPLVSALIWGGNSHAEVTNVAEILKNKVAQNWPGWTVEDFQIQDIHAVGDAVISYSNVIADPVPPEARFAAKEIINCLSSTITGSDTNSLAETITSQTTLSHTVISTTAISATITPPIVGTGLSFTVNQSIQISNGQTQSETKQVTATSSLQTTFPIKEHTIVTARDEWTKKYLTATFHGQVEIDGRMLFRLRKNNSVITPVEGWMVISSEFPSRSDRMVEFAGTISTAGLTTSKTKLIEKPTSNDDCARAGRANITINHPVISKLDLGWCDGRFQHVVNVISLPWQDGTSRKNGTLYQWQQQTQEPCDSARPAWFVNALKGNISNESRYSRDGACVCGFNPRYDCDAGGFKHVISDCYETDGGKYCGYDDQVIGTCDRK